MHDEIFICYCTLKNKIKSKDFEILMEAIESIVILGAAEATARFFTTYCKFTAVCPQDSCGPLLSHFNYCCINYLLITPVSVLYELS